LTTYVFFQAFTLILASVQTTDATRPRAIVRPANLLGPAIIYGSFGLTPIPYSFSASPGSAVDGAGISWDISAINETMMTINVFTVVVIAFLAIAKILRGDTQAPRREAAQRLHPNWCADRRCDLHFRQHRPPRDVTFRERHALVGTVVLADGLRGFCGTPLNRE
jgi:hypothetical protein